jgi:malic enzyme
VSELRQVSLFVAARVAKAAIEAGVATREGLPTDLEGLEKLAAAEAYLPEYLPLVKG